MLHYWVGMFHGCYEETISAALAGHVLNGPSSSGSLICQQGRFVLQPPRDLPLLHVTRLPPTRGRCVCAVWSQWTYLARVVPYTQIKSLFVQYSP